MGYRRTPPSQPLGRSRIAHLRTALLSPALSFSALLLSVLARPASAALSPAASLPVAPAFFVREALVLEAPVSGSPAPASAWAPEDTPAPPLIPELYARPDSCLSLIRPGPAPAPYEHH